MLTKEQFMKVNKILGLTVLLNEQGRYCTFVRFHGHVDDIEVSIRKSKKDYSDEIASSTISLRDRNWGYKSTDERFDEVILTLERFLEENEVPYNYLEVIKRIEYDYKF